MSLFANSLTSPHPDTFPVNDAPAHVAVLETRSGATAQEVTDIADMATKFLDSTQMRVVVILSNWTPTAGFEEGWNVLVDRLRVMPQTTVRLLRVDVAVQVAAFSGVIPKSLFYGTIEPLPSAASRLHVVAGEYIGWSGLCDYRHMLTPCNVRPAAFNTAAITLLTAVPAWAEGCTLAVHVPSSAEAVAAIMSVVSHLLAGAKLAPKPGQAVALPPAGADIKRKSSKLPANALSLIPYNSPSWISFVQLFSFATIRQMFPYVLVQLRRSDIWWNGDDLQSDLKAAFDLSTSVDGGALGMVSIDAAFQPKYTVRQSRRS